MYRYSSATPEVKYKFESYRSEPRRRNRMGPRQCYPFSSLKRHPSDMLSLLCLGPVFGTPLYLLITNRFSRKVSGYLVAVPHIITNILILVANSLEILFVARFIVGIGTAAVTVFTPLYVTEIAEDSVRGSLGTFFVLMFNFGVLLGTRKALLISILLMLNLQLCAPIAILSYTVSIFKDAGSDMSPSISSIIVAILQISGTLLATIFLDRAGRKLILSVSNFFMTVCLCTLGAYFYCKTEAFDLTQIAWLPLVCLSIYIIALALGVSPIPFLMISELFLPEARSNAILLCQIVMWFVYFLVTKFFAIISELLGLYSCYWIFGSCCFVGLLLSLFYFPETKNQSIETIFERLDARETRK
ncbi:hypothetical protein C0J52_07379 [Blattella germanica]|nr:hypothetical protein C0J52_07379 [Blattella germanica]